MTSDYIEIRNLYFSYNGRQNTKKEFERKLVFENISKCFEAEKLTALMAPSGSGKTTLLLLIAGLLKPQSGNITYPFVNPRFSMVFQEDRLLHQETIMNNLKLVNTSLEEGKILHIVEQAGLLDCMKKKAGQLSGGERRRLAIIRALIAEYDILLLDEPFTGLDEATKKNMISLIKEMTSKKTVICVTHDPADTKMLECNTITLP